MLAHHQQSIANVKGYFEQQPEVLALLLGGSIAHGFATPASDVDVLIVVSDEVYADRLARGQVHFFNRELCTYPEGYVDGKFVSRDFLEKVRARGSEPARFAFQDAQVLLSRLEGLPELLAGIAQYPVAEKAERLSRFYAQFTAWGWYLSEALKHANPYLLNTSASKLALFGGRLILAHNERLYPYHKWFLKVLEQAPDKPAGLESQIVALMEHPSHETGREFYDLVNNFRAWPSPDDWPTQFMLDSELNWMDGTSPVDDL
jgi:hypothetical protein